MEKLMSEPNETHILCAVRGQPTSRSTVEHAIELALEVEASLTFLLVIATEPLTKATPLKAPLRVVLNQLESIGEFAMALLEDRAAHEGLDNVQSIVRRGKPVDTIRQAVADIQPDIIVLGQPVPDEPRAIFTPAEFDRFVEALQEDVEAEIVVVETPVADLPN
jgi:nucleotide-binding universal stress UspA family protein